MTALPSPLGSIWDSAAGRYVTPEAWERIKAERRPASEAAERERMKPGGEYDQMRQRMVERANSPDNPHRPEGKVLQPYVRGQDPVWKVGQQTPMANQWDQQMGGGQLPGGPVGGGIGQPQGGRTPDYSFLDQKDGETPQDWQQRLRRLQATWYPAAGGNEALQERLGQVNKDVRRAAKDEPPWAGGVPQSQGGSGQGTTRAGWLQQPSPMDAIPQGGIGQQQPQGGFYGQAASPIWGAAAGGWTGGWNSGGGQQQQQGGIWPGNQQGGIGQPQGGTGQPMGQQQGGVLSGPLDMAKLGLRPWRGGVDPGFHKPVDWSFGGTRSTRPSRSGGIGQPQPQGGIWPGNQQGGGGQQQGGGGNQIDPRGVLRESTGKYDTYPNLSDAQYNTMMNHPNSGQQPWAGGAGSGGWRGGKRVDPAPGQGGIGQPQQGGIWPGNQQGGYNSRNKNFAKKPSTANSFKYNPRNY